MISTDDIAAAFRTRWAAASLLSALVPAAAVYLGRAAEATALPYARLLIDEGVLRWTSGRRYQKDFAVTVEVYTNDPAAAPAVRHAVDAAFGASVADPAGGLSLPAAGDYVTHSLPAAGGGTAPANERRDGNDILRVTGKFAVLTEGQ